MMLGKLFKLSTKEILYLFPAFSLLFICKVAIMALPFHYLQKNFQKFTNNHTRNILTEAEIDLKAKSINRIAFRLSFLGFNCLPKAMAFKYWLKNYENIQVNFGVQKDEQNLLIAHAWVSKGNKIILGEDPSKNYKSIWVWQ